MSDSKYSKLFNDIKNHVIDDMKNSKFVEHATQKKDWKLILLGMVAAFFMFSLIFGRKGSSYERQLKYCEKYKDIAIKEAIRTGIPPSITLAQGALESGNGRSKLARKYKNHFGVKCHGNKSCTKRGQFCDDDCDDQFRVYKSTYQSYKDHSDFLAYQNVRRYGFLWNYGRDYKKWARGLQEAGYATGKTYASKLIRIINRHKLYKYDSPDMYAFDYENIDKNAKKVLAKSSSKKKRKKSSSSSKKKKSSKKSTKKKEDTPKKVKKRKPKKKVRVYTADEKKRIELQEKVLKDLEQQLVKNSAKIDVVIENNHTEFPPEYWELERKKIAIQDEITFNQQLLKMLKK